MSPNGLETEVANERLSSALVHPTADQVVHSTSTGTGTIVSASALSYLQSTLSIERSIMKKTFLTAALTLGLGLSNGAALSHHGWSWTTGENMELTGVIKKIRLGNPHGIIEVEVGGEMWVIEVGQPWRNERAGLKDGDLSEGVEIRVNGEPAADKSRRLKVERLFLGDREYVLYPDRD